MSIFGLWSSGGKLAATAAAVCVLCPLPYMHIPTPHGWVWLGVLILWGYNYLTLLLHHLNSIGIGHTLKGPVTLC